MGSSIALVVVMFCAAIAGVFSEGPLDDRRHFPVELQNFNHGIEKRAAKDQSAIYGSNGPNDRLIHYEKVDVSRGILQIKKKDVTYPTDHNNSGQTITCIKVIDQIRNGKNADFKVSSGGVGSKFAIINMRSQRGEPIKYNVHIYGR